MVGFCLCLIPVFHKHSCVFTVTQTLLCVPQGQEGQGLETEVLEAGGWVLEARGWRLVRGYRG